MSSIQQVAMAAVCLAAAFAFGSFINQAPNQQSNQHVAEASDHLRSLMEPDIAVQKSPAKTPWMKPRLTARMPMPSLPNANSQTSQTANDFGLGFSSVGEIPPPSDRTGRIGASLDNATSSLFNSQPSALVADAPTFGSDFNESSMPTVIGQTFSRSPNLADSMRAPSQPDFNAPPQPPVQDAPVFSVAEYTSAETLPTAQSLQPKPYISSKPRLPDRAMRPFERAPRTATGQTFISSPDLPIETATANTLNQFRRRFDAASEPTNQNTANRDAGLMPIPSINQPIRITDPGGAFGNPKPQLKWGSNSTANPNNDSAYYPEASRQRPTQQRVVRLPLQLNSNAKSKLTRLRNNTIQKISLSTTQFSDHVVERGDSLQSIASKYFGKPDFYLDIYLANRDRLRFPGDIREGMTIKIPVYE